MKTRPISCLQRGYSVVKEQRKKTSPAHADKRPAPGSYGQYRISNSVSRPFYTKKLTFFCPPMPVTHKEFRSILRSNPGLPAPLHYRPITGLL
jgi:hypothetical protein